jgi:hypothetical protein
VTTQAGLLCDFLERLLVISFKMALEAIDTRFDMKIPPAHLVCPYRVQHRII